MKTFWRRTSHNLVALIGLVVIVFVMTRLSGNPVTLYLPEGASQEQRDAMTRQLGLDQPLLTQFGDFVRQLIHLDLGTSLSRQQPALDVVLDRYPTTLTLAGITLAIALVLALVLGAVSALKPGGLFDRLATIISLTGAAVPDFWLAIMGILIFSVQLDLLPTTGMGGPQYWVLPVAVLMSRPLGVLVQVVRGAVIGELNNKYVKTAESKGLPARRVIMVHTLRNSLVPVITVFGLQTAAIINGAVVVEVIFGWPGVGQLMLDSVHRQDFPLIQATVLVTATAVFLVNAVTDVLTTVIDPRTRRPS